MMNEFKQKFNDDFYTAQIYNACPMLGRGMAKAKSTDPVKVAAAMEGLKFKSFNGEVEMRKADHQLQQTLYITRVAEGRRKPPDYSVENTGYTFGAGEDVPAYVSSTPTSCQMKRPAELGPSLSACALPAGATRSACAARSRRRHRPRDGAWTSS